MGRADHLCVHLDEQMRVRVATGRHKFLGHLCQAFEGLGWSVEVGPDTQGTTFWPQKRARHNLFHMTPAPLSRGLIFRKAYLYPFWKIERTGTRWKFECAGQVFDPEPIPAARAKSFADTLRRREMPWADPGNVTQDVIYIPLQGRLLQMRSHQAMSPLDMVRTTLERFPDDPIRITLHPREKYGPKEINALNALAAQFSRCEVSRDPPQTLLGRAKLVVTQNSSVAFWGLLLKKPAVLFADSDFHHIFPGVSDMGARCAFDAALSCEIAYDQYLFWFLQNHSINAGRDDVQARIIARVRALGWPV